MFLFQKLLIHSSFKESCVHR